MMRRTNIKHAFRTTAVLRVWTAEEDDPHIPNTTFKNVKPAPMTRLWRQIRQFVWTAFVLDEAYPHLGQEAYQNQMRMEQICFLPLSAYGAVPGSYCDPLLYNTKTTSPFRWHVSQNSSDIVGHWYIDFDELQRIKDWKPKNPDDPMELFPRPPNRQLEWEEQIDEHGNRNFRYKYRYDVASPYGLPGVEPHQKYPTSVHYFDDQRGGKVEPYGFKQGELLRCNEEEAKVVRRIMEEEDREWDMIKRTEIIQQPHTWPGHVRSEDFFGGVERAKAKFREQIKEGKQPNPELDEDYDLVQAGEFAEPRDNIERSVSRDLWQQDRKGGPNAPTEYEVYGNWGTHLDQNINRPPEYPEEVYQSNPRAAPTFEMDGKDPGGFEVLNETNLPRIKKGGDKDKKPDSK